MWADVIRIDSLAAVERMDKQDTCGGDGDLVVGLHSGGSSGGREDGQFRAIYIL